MQYEQLIHIFTVRCNARTVHAVRPSVLSVCSSICLSHASIVPERLNVGSCKQCLMIAHGHSFSDARELTKMLMGSPPAGHQVELG